MRIRELSSVEEMRQAAALIDGIWGETRIVTPELLRAIATHGGLVLGAFDDALVGAQMGFVGLTDGELVLHSHVTGVAGGRRGRGVGRALKLAQREWCLAHGIDTVTWTFDPLIARNAAFNLQKLGALAVAFLPDFYGPMEDAFNAGDRTDRLEVRWEVRSERVERALAGGLDSARDGEVLLEDRDGEPRTNPDATGDRGLIEIPADYLALRAADPDVARRWREAVAEALEGAMGAGYLGVGFIAPRTYVLERP